MMANLKTCPYCNSKVPVTATKCKYCGEWLEEEILEDANTTMIASFSGYYENMKKIDRGGMAVVYKARQKSLDRIVALKIVLKEFTHDKEFIERFKIEARVVGALNHTNIISIYDFGEIYGYPYIAMEYLEGGTLSQRIKNKKAKGQEFTAEDIKNTLIPVLEALGYAHNKGLIHRDIKSSNIMFDKTGRPVLMDFGIAKSADSTQLTKAGTYMGTPEYSSPEQADSDKELDHRTDLYSLGVVAYEMATGRVPFKGNNPISVLHDVIHKTPTLIKHQRPTLDRGLANAIMRSLSKNPDDRYQDTKEFISALYYGEEQNEDIFYKSQNQKNNQYQEKSNKTKERSSYMNNSLLAISLILVIILAVSSYYYFKPNYSPAYYQKEQVNETNDNKSSKFEERSNEYVKKQNIKEKILKYMAKGETAFSNKDYEKAIATFKKARVLEPENKYIKTLIEKAQLKLNTFNELQRKKKILKSYNMVFVKGGSFTMGTNSGESNTRPAHSKAVDDFYISKFEVTQKEWKAIMNNNPSTNRSPNNPVETVSWYEVNEFIKKLNRKTGMKFRLPTEFEWEYAATAKGESFRYAGSNNQENVAWCWGNSNNQTHPVGQKKANSLGLKDMSGNVWEWCSSDYSENYNSHGLSNLKVVRGGGFETIVDCKTRTGYSLSTKEAFIGMRLAHDKL